jgi:hypothetical protein
MMLLVILAILVIIPQPASSFSLQPTQSGWGIFDIETSSIAVYDYDHDNVPEVIGSPEFVIDNQAVFTGSYRNLQNLVVVSGLLVSYGSRGVDVYDGLNEISSSPQPTSSAVVSLDGSVGVVGDKLIYRGSVHRYTLSSHYIALASLDGSPVIAYYMNSTDSLHLYYDGSFVDLKISVVPKAAYALDNHLYIIGTGKTGIVFLSIENITAGKYVTTGSSLPGSATVIGFDAPKSSFLVYYSGVVYLVGSNGTISFLTGKPLCHDGLKTYILSGDSILVFDGFSGLVVKKLPAPPLEFTTGSCNRGLIAVKGVNGEVGVYYPSKKPEISIVVQRTTYVLMPVNYMVEYRNAKNIIVTLNSTVIPSSGFITFNKTGTYRLEAHASNGFIESYTYADIVVLPRPIQISIKMDKPPIAFEKDNVTIEVYDSLSNNSVKTSCTLNVPNVGEIQTSSWQRTEIPIIPSGGAYSLGVTCGGDGVYEKTYQSLALLVEPSSTRLKILHPYKGVLIFEAVNKVGQLVKGKINVLCCGKLYTRENPLVFKVPIGEHDAKITFIPDEEYYRGFNTTVHLFYPVNQSTLQAVNGSTLTVYLEKVPYNVTKTVTKQVPITIPKNVVTLSKTQALLIGVATAFLSIAGYYVAEKYGLTGKIAERLKRLFKRKR